jgi:transposase
MAKAYSLDLRERVIAAVDGGTKPAEAAERFRVTERTIWNWLSLRKQTGQLAPRQGDVGPDYVLETQRERILQSVQDNPAQTLPQLHRQLDLPGCVSTLWNALQRWGVTLKKSPQGC